MNAIMNAIQDIKLTIPSQILDLVFGNREAFWKAAPESVDSRILSMVIRPRVLKDLNLVGGAEMLVSLQGVPCEIQPGNDYTMVYRIPKSRTNGRTIMSALNVTFSNPGAISTVNPYVDASSSQLLNVASQLLDSMGTIPITSTAYVQLIGENVVMVRDTTMLPTNIYLRCVVANDENLNHLQHKSYRPFSQLCQHAVKAYIYNNHIIPMDMAELQGGQALGRIKEIIDSYSDQEELYQTFLTEKMQKIMLMNDGETWMRMLRMQISGQR